MGSRQFRDYPRGIKRDNLVSATAVYITDSNATVQKNYEFNSKEYDKLLFSNEKSYKDTDKQAIVKDVFRQMGLDTSKFGNEGYGTGGNSCGELSSRLTKRGLAGKLGNNPKDLIRDSISKYIQTYWNDYGTPDESVVDFVENDICQIVQQRQTTRDKMAKKKANNDVGYDISELDGMTQSNIYGTQPGTHRLKGTTFDERLKEAMFMGVDTTNMRVPQPEYTSERQVLEKNRLNRETNFSRARDEQQEQKIWWAVAIVQVIVFVMIHTTIGTKSAYVALAIGVVCTFFTYISRRYAIPVGAAAVLYDIGYFLKLRNHGDDQVLQLIAIFIIVMVVLMKIVDQARNS